MDGIWEGIKVNKDLDIVLFWGKREGEEVE